MYMYIDLFSLPVGFSEKLFKKLETCREKFEIRILLLNLISRLIGVHKVQSMCLSTCNNAH